MSKMKTNFELLPFAFGVLVFSFMVARQQSNRRIGNGATTPMGWNSYDAWGTSVTKTER